MALEAAKKIAMYEIVSPWYKASKYGIPIASILFKLAPGKKMIPQTESGVVTN